MLFFFFFNDPATTEIYTLSLHDALPICRQVAGVLLGVAAEGGDHAGNANARADVAHQVEQAGGVADLRSEEHTSELQSLRHLVCRLLLEKKKKKKYLHI